MNAPPPQMPPPLQPQALRAALRHFQDRLQAQEAQFARLQRQISQQAAELAACREALQRSTAGRTRLSDTPALHHMVRALRGLLPRRWRETLGRAPFAAGAQGAPDYRVRLRALRASGQLARTRSVALVAPESLRRAATSAAQLIEAMGLRCTVHSIMPTAFADDLYLVLSPRAFAQLPPPDRRILWLVESGELAGAWNATLHARLDGSLAVFEALQPRIAELQAHGLVQHQIFHVPLTPFTAPDPERPDHSPLGLPHMLARALHGCGVVNDATFEAATAQTRLDAPALVLCLPEAPERFALARESERHGALLFPGLRHVDGWKGTALSYRYLARRALAAGRERLVIWEDDARLPADFDTRLPALLARLEAQAGAWDVFSGLITDLSPQGEVKAVHADGANLLIELDTVIGMVFGVYGPKALNALAGYRMEGEDVMKDTIDRYLETLDLRCWTTFPPLVGHADHVSSTLWDPTGGRFLSNEWLNPMIDGSQFRLLAKIADRLEGAAPPPPDGR